MPETHFTIVWPDGVEDRCYSPSTIVYSHFSEGDQLPLKEFMDRVDRALSEASERVRARYGYACSSAVDQLRLLKEKESELEDAGIFGPVRIVSMASSGAPEPIKRAAPPHYPVVVIGAGQAGLSMSFLLKQAGIQHLVIEKNQIAHAWRNERWDSFCLVTPNWQCKLPGYCYSGDEPDGFMVKDEIVDFLEGYAKSFSPPLQTGVALKRLSKSDRGFRLETSAGEISASQVVVATGGFHTPKIPSFAGQLPPSIKQIHSRDYLRPSDLPDGEVLVVGSGQSGCQIAEDLLLAGRKVHLSLGEAPRCARRYRGKDVVEWLDRMGHYDIPVDEMPDPEAARAKTNHYVTGRDGGRDIDLREFTQRGMSLHGSAIKYEGGHLHFQPNLATCLDEADDSYRRINKSIDKFIEESGIECEAGSDYTAPWEPEQESDPLNLAESGITSIVWSIGFAAGYDWLDLKVLDERGAPLHERGVTGESGVYFLGLPWLHTWGSGRFCGVARDAEYLLECIQERLAVSASTVSVAF